jgi:hypothetical protein
MFKITMILATRVNLERRAGLLFRSFWSSWSETNGMTDLSNDIFRTIDSQRNGTSSEEVSSQLENGNGEDPSWRA